MADCMENGKSIRSCSTAFRGDILIVLISLLAHATAQDGSVTNLSAKTNDAAREKGRHCERDENRQFYTYSVVSDVVSIFYTKFDL